MASAHDTDDASMRRMSSSMHGGISTSANANTTHADGYTAPRHSCAFGGSGCLSPRYAGTPRRGSGTSDAVRTAVTWGTLDSTVSYGSKHSRAFCTSSSNHGMSTWHGREHATHGLQVTIQSETIRTLRMWLKMQATL